MWLLDARVDHLDQDVCVVSEFYHKFLVLLHVSEAIFLNKMSIVEEQVILRCELNFDILEIVRVTLKEIPTITTNLSLDLPIALF